jgi:hypothetical protein
MKRTIEGVATGKDAGKYTTLKPAGDSTFELWGPVQNTNLNSDQTIEWSMTVGELQMIR